MSQLDSVRANALPKVSIITVTLNSARTLERAIHSVIDQHYPNLEYIIVDGGSTDGTLDIVQKCETHIAKWVSEKDKGPGDAVNKGIQMASGDIIGILASDDLYLPGAFDALAAAAMQNPAADVFYGDMIFDCAVRPPFRVRPKRPPLRPSDFHGLPLSVPAVFIRRECYAQHGLWDTRYLIANDYELMLRLVSAKVEFCYLERALVYMYGGGLHSRDPGRIDQEVRAILRKHHAPRHTRLKFEFNVLLSRAKAFARESSLTRPLVHVFYKLRNKMVRPYHHTRST